MTRIVRCAECDDEGWVTEIEPECCGRRSPSGECCGDPDPRQVQVDCPKCKTTDSALRAELTEEGG